MCNTEKSEIRFCGDIGMWTIDRSRLTCKHRTSFCNENCFNISIEKRFHKTIGPKDKRNDAYWQALTGEQLAATLDNKRSFTDRIRFMSRGEAISTMADIAKVKDIVTSNPGRVFWMPTRAWRRAELKAAIEAELMPLGNLRILASLDPSNSEAEVNMLVTDGWSTMFFGNDDQAPIENSYKCPKTWEHVKGACATCAKGCFNKNQVHVHLKQH